MAHQSEPARFQTLFETALRVYEENAGIALTEHPFVLKLQSCDTEAITAILQDQAQGLSDRQGSDEIMKSIKTTVSILSKISSPTSLADAFGLIFTPVKAIQACLAILLDAAKGIKSNCDALVELLESIEHFVSRLNIYTWIPSTPVVDEMVVKILMELISILARVTESLKRQCLIKFAKRFFRENESEAVLKRLDQLTQAEARATAVHKLAVVHGLIQSMGEFMDDGNASMDGVLKDLKIIHQIASDMRKSKRDHLLSEIRSWLSPPDPRKNHNFTRSLRQDQTGTWFINSDTFSEWKASGPSSLLWIHGEPGSGKSVLCSTIIENIEDMQNLGFASLAMFYHDFREDEKKNLRGLLSSILFQLCEQSDAYYNALTSLYSTHCHGGPQRPSDDELVRCLKNVLSLPEQPPVYLIVDALDELTDTSALSSPREEILVLLEDLVSSQLPNLRICITSRHEADIKPVLEPLSFRSVSLHGEMGQKEDVKNYIKLVVNTNKNMGRWRPEHRQLVISVLIERADGIFRWVYCQLDYLSKCLPGCLRHALDELPATLDETYERTLHDIDDTNWEFARQLLQCVAVVSRPLQVKGLAEFLAFGSKAGQIPTFQQDQDRRIEDRVETVLSTCSTLFSIINVEDFQVIQFSHLSVKEFLTSDHFSEKRNAISGRYHVSMTPAHTLVAKACLGMLLHLDKDITRDVLSNVPLAEYAAKHWFKHARFEGVSQNVFEEMKQLFDQGKPHLAIWLWIYDPAAPFWQENNWSYPHLELHGTPLHYAAFCGLNDVVKTLAVEHPQDVNSPSFAASDNETALHLVSRAGHIDLVQLLVEHGADVAAQNEKGVTPLHRASEEGHVDVAQLLIEHGANAAVQSGYGMTPLQWASEGGHVDLARLLIKHGADVAAQNNHGMTPLGGASERGHAGLARLLMEYGANAAARSSCGTTPLHRASFGGHIDLARLLIEHGADATALNWDGVTPLHWASGGGHVDLAQLLIRHGADAAAQTKHGTTPLHYASSGGHVDLARLLIKYGADATAQSGDGLTPLHNASEGGHVDLALFLIQHGADVAALNGDGATPLHQTSLRGHVNLARLLIEHGADAAARSEDGSTPLHRASLGRHLDLARLLIEHGADVSAHKKDGVTPLDFASSFNHVDLVRLLIEHGADVTVRSKDRTTPLHRVCYLGDVDIARLLIEHGADVAAQTNNGITPLHQASEQGHMDLAQLLIEHGADVTAQRKDGETPLHRALAMCHVDLARLLVENGADAAAKTKDGTTPLHRASVGACLDVARFLIKHGANAAVERKDGTTPLHGVSFYGDVDLARLLIEHGADVAAHSNKGSTPLHQASSRGHVDLARVLIEHGADVAARSKDGTTPLHLASEHGHMDLVRLLVMHGADTAAQRKDEMTPLRLATRYSDLAQFLRSHQALHRHESPSDEDPGAQNDDHFHFDWFY